MGRHSESSDRKKASKKDKKQKSGKKHHHHKSEKKSKQIKRSRKEAEGSQSSDDSSISSEQRKSRKRARPESSVLDTQAQIAALPKALQLLIEILSAYPTLPVELVDLLNALDNNEAVCLDGVGNEYLRSNLSAFLLSIGLQADTSASGSQIFNKKKASDSCNDVMIMLADMLDASNLTHIPVMIPDVQSAVASCCDLIDKMSQCDGMEDITNEIPDIMKQLLDGEIIVIDELPDEQLKTFMVNVFTALNLQSQITIEGEGYGIPHDTVTNNVHISHDSINDAIREAIRQSIQGVIAKYTHTQHNDSTQSSITPASNEDNQQNVNKDNDKDNNTDNDASDEDEGPKAKKSIGPARPDSSILEKAAIMYSNRNYNNSTNDSDNDGDDIGPSLHSNRNVITNTTEHDNDGDAALKRKADWARVMTHDNISSDTNSKDEKSNDVSNSNIREEWMIVPPKSLGVLGALKLSTQPTNRTFQNRSARGRNNAIVDNTIEKASQIKSQAEINEEIAADVIMKKHRELRGPTLADIHANKSKEQIRLEKKQRDMIEAERIAKTQEAAGAPVSNKRKSNNNNTSTFSWNRDEDFETHRKMTPQAYQEFVQKSKQLDTRFSKSITKNFM